MKRSASSDSRLETLKKFRVDKHSKRHNDVGPHVPTTYLAPSQTQTPVIQKNAQQHQRIPPHLNNCSPQRSVTQPILASANVRSTIAAGGRTTVVQNANARNSYVSQTCTTSGTTVKAAQVSCLIFLICTGKIYLFAHFESKMILQKENTK